MDKHKPEYRHVSYLETIELDRYCAKAPMAQAILKKYDFDAIAFRGLSGALIAIPMAHALDKTMIAVRKKGENNHSGAGVEGDWVARRYVIMDDMISTGNTVRTIMRAIKNFSPNAECLGTLVWLSMSPRSVLYPPEDAWRVFPKGSYYDEFGESRERDWRDEKKEQLEKEKQYAEVNQQQAAQAGKEEVPQDPSCNSGLYPVGLRPLAERPKPEANRVGSLRPKPRLPSNWLRPF